nr:putative ribonuclease H-like domain, chromo domain-like protein [Tanacetum cinerariifolium]
MISKELKLEKARIYIPFRSNFKDLLLEEAYKSKYSIHPGATKMYLDLKSNYWWPGMKRDCVKYVEKCLTCLKVKAKHQKPYGKIQPLEIPIWKWEKITMDFVTKLPRTTKKHDGVMLFKNKEKLSPRFIRPFKILKRVREVAYTLELPKEIKEINPESTFQEASITILGRKSRQLHKKEIMLVKVEWKHQKGTSILGGNRKRR